MKKNDKKKKRLYPLLYLIVLTILPLVSSFNYEENLIINNSCLNNEFTILENSTADLLTINSTCEGDINNITAFSNPYYLKINNTGSTNGTIILLNMSYSLIILQNETVIPIEGENQSYNKTLIPGEFVTVISNNTVVCDNETCQVNINYPATFNTTWNETPDGTLNLTLENRDENFLSTIYYWLVDGVTKLAGIGENVFNYVFTFTPENKTSNVTLIKEFNGTNTTEEIIINMNITAPIIDIETPNGTLTYNYIGGNETLNVTFTDEHLDECWYNYNGTNTSIPGCSSGVKNSMIFTLEDNNLNLTVYSNDTIGALNYQFVNWTYKLLEINQTYNNETTEGSLETFLATTKVKSDLTISDAVLINYNGTESAGQSFTDGENTILRKQNLLIPNVENETTVTLFWNVTLSDSTNIILTSRDQTIYPLDISDCSNYTKELFNFTVVDEESQVILPNATMEIAVNLYDASRTALVLNYSNIFQETNPLAICINRDLSNSSSYSIDTVVRYEDSESANEYYNIVNQTLRNNTETQIITLYDLNLSDSTDFQLTFTGSDFLPVENALVYLDRQYISENTFKTVELPKTDYNGQTVLHLVRNDVIYNIRITKDGIVLGNFDNLIAFCDDYTIGDCNIELNAFDSTEGIFDYDENLGILYQKPVYNETKNEVSFNFVTADGSAKEVLLEVTRNDIFGNRSVCNSSLISSGGTLSCTIESELDEAVLNTNIYVDNILSVKTSVAIESSNYGEGGYLVVLVMTFSIMLFFMSSKEGVLISMIVSLASAMGLGLTSGNVVGLGASGIWVLVILIVGIYKLNKDRQQ